MQAYTQTHHGQKIKENMQTYLPLPAPHKRKHSKTQLHDIESFGTMDRAGLMYRVDG